MKSTSPLLFISPWSKPGWSMNWVFVVRILLTPITQWSAMSMRDPATLQDTQKTANWPTSSGTTVTSWPTFHCLITQRESRWILPTVCWWTRDEGSGQLQTLENRRNCTHLLESTSRRRFIRYSVHTTLIWSVSRWLFEQDQKSLLFRHFWRGFRLH